MSAAERRAAIISATRPLLTTEGAQFTTRQVAEAAGIAEGTIFRHFATKSDLLHAVVEDLLDPSRVCAALEQLRPKTATEAVVGIVILMREAATETSALFHALHTRPPLESKPEAETDAECARDKQMAMHEERTQRVRVAMVSVLTPFAPHFSIPVEAVASYIRSVTIASAHPALSDNYFTEPQHIAELIVNGVIARETPCS